MSTNPKTRIVRKVPFVSKIRSYPYDLVLSWNERFQLVDWEELAREYSIYTAIVLNSFLVIAKAYIDQSTVPKYKTLRIKTPESALLVSVKIVYHLLNSISLINFFVSVTSFKNYDLITRDINKVPNTPSAFKIEIDKPVAITEDSRYFLVRISNYFFDILHHRVFPKEKVNETNKKLSWRLVVWSPSAFQLHTLALFSPLNIAFVYLVKPIGLAGLIFLIILTVYQYFIIIVKYEVKLKDEFTIHQNYLQEYDVKYVNPRLNRRYVDKSVDGWNTGNVRAFYPDKRTRNFVTHNL